MASSERIPDVNPVSLQSKERTAELSDRSSTSPENKDELGKPLDPEKKDSGSAGGTISPSQSSATYPHALPAHLTPQQPGYYVAYQSQVTPEPPSPAGPGALVYDVGAFLQQPTAFHNSPFAAHQYPVQGQAQQQSGQPPQSPTQNSMGGITPASPLFPRITGQAAAGILDHRMLDGSAAQARGAPLSPGPPYITQGLGPSGTMYPSMNAYSGPGQNIPPSGGNNTNGSPDELSGWGDNRNPQVSPYPHNSPQISAQGIPIPYVPGMPPRTANVAGRSYSFEDSMLPPSAESQPQQQQGQDQNGSFSQFTVSPSSQGVGAPGTLFAHQQPWGYAGPPPDMYGASASPLQPRPTMGYPGMHGAPPRHHGPPPMGPYGGHQFYPATSPGPPIQTTASNKGPDGANLFIFHIPNHFTNLDMYQLFCPYGNLLSVRIMVEKDTGRSRGFGFVSYDSPDAAALAIKELNGFAIGNKRLKVQHKQIRPSDQHHDRNSSQNQHHQGGYDSHSGGGMGGGQYGMHTGSGHGGGQMSSSLPPSGPMAASTHNSSGIIHNDGSNNWYNRHGAGAASETAGDKGVITDQQQTSEGSGAGIQHSSEPVGNSAAVADTSTSVDGPLAGLEPLRNALPEVGTAGD